MPGLAKFYGVQREPWQPRLLNGDGGGGQTITGSCQKDGRAENAAHRRSKIVDITCSMSETYTSRRPFGMLLANVARHGTLLPIQTLNMRSSASVVSR